MKITGVLLLAVSGTALAAGEGGLYRCETAAGDVRYQFKPTCDDGRAAVLVSDPSAPDPHEARLQAAFAKVKIGMTIEEVERIDQVGNACTDWPHQKPPKCGPLRYYWDKRTVESASGKTVTYSWARRQIVYRDGVVVLILR
jgi:hypothetical protein